MALRPNWCVFQEGRGGPVGCQATKFECRSCYTVLSVSLSLSLSLCVLASCHISICIDRIPFWGLIDCFSLNIFVDTNSSPAPNFRAAQLRVLSLRGCQDAAAGIERPLLHTAASCSDALCVFTIRYGSIFISITFFFLLFGHLSAFQCVSIHLASPCLISVFP